MCVREDTKESFRSHSLSLESANRAEHIVAKPADIDELLCAAVLSVFRSCKHNE